MRTSSSTVDDVAGGGHERAHRREELVGRLLHEQLRRVGPGEVRLRGNLHAVLLQPRDHLPLPVDQRVAVAPGDQAPRQAGQRLRRRHRLRRIAEIVVPVRARRQRETPELVVRLQRQHRVVAGLLLRRRPCHAAEVRLVQHQPAHHGGAQVEALGPDAGVERHVPAGAAPHDEAPRQVAVRGDPGVPRRRVAEPEHGRDGVVVGGGEAVLGREAVVEGDDDGWHRRGHGLAGGVVEDAAGGEEDEAAAVEVEDDGELGRRRWSRVGEVEAERRGEGGVERHVAGEDRAGGGGRRVGDDGAGDGAVRVDGDLHEEVGRLVRRRGRGDGGLTHGVVALLALLLGFGKIISAYQPREHILYSSFLCDGSWKQEKELSQRCRPPASILGVTRAGLIVASIQPATRKNTTLSYVEERAERALLQAPADSTVI